jgi:hypothetical protein
LCYRPVRGENDAEMGPAARQEFLSCCVARASLNPIHVRCFPIRQASCALSPFRRIA